MKLKLHRSQRSAMTGGVVFKMRVIVDLDPGEAEAIKKYKLKKEVVYQTPMGDAAQRVQQVLRLGPQSIAPRRPVEDLDPGLALERLDPAQHRCMVDTDHPRGAGKRVLLGNRQHDLQVIP